ncbi:MAG: hypothetical protein M1541_10475, partial [Acidobacteria bacterium]|nr:hypothetical protein [Acidobacteriota bacterium]
SALMPWAAMAQQTPPPAPTAPAATAPPCAGMMGNMSQAMAKMDQMDMALQQKVTEMNAAKGTKKVDLMGNIIEQMVNERRQLHATMLNMMNSRRRMIGGMGGPMMMRGNQGMGPGMQNCPCMQQNSGAAGRAAPAPRQ